jgi:hypothetical protein
LQWSYSCLNFKRNIDKAVESAQPLNPLPKHPDEISHSTNIEYEKEKEKESIIY